MRYTPAAMPTPRQLPLAPRSTDPVVAGALLLLALALVSACGSEPPAPAESYRVRGLVRQLPARAGGEVQIRHEAIPDFKNADGEVVGMDSMTMPFPVADAGLLAGIEAGDRIEMEFVVRWSGGHPLEIVAMEKLPPETRLAFETAPEAEAEPAEAEPEPAPEPAEAEHGTEHEP